MDKYYFAALFAAFGSRSAEIAEAAAKFKSPAEAYMLRRKHGRKPELMKKQLINSLPKGILIILPG